MLSPLKFTYGHVDDLHCGDVSIGHRHEARAGTSTRRTHMAAKVFHHKSGCMKKMQARNVALDVRWHESKKLQTGRGDRMERCFTWRSGSGPCQGRRYRRKSFLSRKIEKLPKVHNMCDHPWKDRPNALTSPTLAFTTSPDGPRAALLTACPGCRFSLHPTFTDD